jgi:bifunctional non-homologous end joining protein LigD
MQQGKPGTPIVYYVFDVLEVEGEPRRRPAALERRSGSRSCSTAATGRRLLEAFEDGARCYEAAKEQALEGIMASGSTRATCRQAHARLAQVQDARRAGVRHRRLHEGQGPARVLVRLARAGRTSADELEYVGNVGTGFDDDEIEQLLDEARPLERKTRRSRSAEDAAVRKGDVVWVEPKLVAEVEFAEWTHDGRLRAPVYQGCARTRTRARCAASAEPIPT